MDKHTLTVTEDVQVVLDGKSCLLQKGDKIAITEGIMDVIKRVAFAIVKKFAPIPPDVNPEDLGLVELEGNKYNLKNKGDLLKLFANYKSRL